jgi:hypothetical protein
MVSIEDGGNGEGDSIGVLNNKCQWTLFERKARLPYMYISTFSSQFSHYEIMRKPYIVFYDSLYSKHWGTSSSFDIYVSTGSACNSELAVPSHVLTACHADLDNYSPIRVSIGKYNTKEEIDEFIKVLISEVSKLRNKVN